MTNNYDFYLVEENEKVIKWIEDNLDGDEFVICDESSREDLVRTEIENSAWAFNTEFILRHSKSSITYDVLKHFQEVECESSNDFVLEIIEDFDEFVSNAINGDGYGHFLSRYDGKENDISIDGNEYFIYRNN